MFASPGRLAEGCGDYLACLPIQCVSLLRLLLLLLLLLLYSPTVTVAETVCWCLLLVLVWFFLAHVGLLDAECLILPVLILSCSNLLSQ